MDPPWPANGAGDFPLSYNGRSANASLRIAIRAAMIAEPSQGDH
jgi:hypothetical protein